MKTLWFDTETTGVDCKKNDIVQIAGIVEINGNIVDEFEYFQQPRSADTVESGALRVQKKTLDEIMAYPENGNIYRKMSKKLNEHVSKFDKRDKLMPAGQNVTFDKNFMFSLWAQHNDFYLGSYFFGGNIDTLTAAAIAVEMGLIPEPTDKTGKCSYRLDAIALCLGVDLENAHSAVDDIKATRECYLKIKNLFCGGKNQ